MRALPLLAASALLATACSNACDALGERLCECAPAGTTKTSCVDAAKAEVSRVNPNHDQQAACDAYLSTCYARAGIEFCPWIAGRCGKAACGLSGENYAVLSDPAKTPNPDDPSKALCPK